MPEEEYETLDAEEKLNFLFGMLDHMRHFGPERRGGQTRILKLLEQYGDMTQRALTVMLGIQVLLNVAVVTSSMPATGIALPFVSYGGNALLLFMGSAGIMLNIAKQQKREAEAEMEETE